ncbi:hypothetical protein ACP275_12G075700 [Erythranthe tilingii]
MALVEIMFFLLLLLLSLLDSAYSKCPKSFECGRLGNLEFPASNSPGCGLFTVDGCDSENPTIQLESGGEKYGIVRNISTTNSFLIKDYTFHSLLETNSCFSFINRSLPKSPSISFSFSPNLTLVACVNETYSQDRHEYFENYQSYSCSALAVYYGLPPQNASPPVPNGDGFPQECRVIQLPVKSNYDQYSTGYVFDLLTSEYILEWNVSENCSDCHRGGGQCLSNSMGQFECKRDNNRTLILALSIGGGGVLILLCLFVVSFIMWQRKKRIKDGSFLLSRNLSYDPSSKPDVEGGGNSYYGIPIFSYKELEEATNHFDPSQELGDGGFGTVYYGKLRDGREVAIKRLYEHNYRRVEQFMNEIKILTCLRHPNLVSLYGCTSRKSRELLLVYEYISNGTIADHLHGERAHESPLTWPVRLSVAIETATALAYLHKSDIIHRDVKTNNILLDENYCVKVADFGLSRLFPNDVTHISTAPQGTPGYVDPEYHQCYQLTDRSDVYSFGVVLIELISSMPAVDISRHRHEINLANLAVNRIQRCEFDELIDSSLGYGTDAEVARMTTSVAELAFRCLQLDKDMRPCMDEVLAFLKDIRAGGGDCNLEKVEGENGNCTGGQGKVIPPSPETDDVVLLKNKKFQPSPTGVTDAWVSGSSTTTTSSIG